MLTVVDGYCGPPHEELEKKDVKVVRDDYLAQLREMQLAREWVNGVHFTNVEIPSLSEQYLHRQARLWLVGQLFHFTCRWQGKSSTAACFFGFPYVSCQAPSLGTTTLIFYNCRCCCCSIESEKKKRAWAFSDVKRSMEARVATKLIPSSCLIYYCKDTRFLVPC